VENNSFGFIIIIRGVILVIDLDLI